MNQSIYLQHILSKRLDNGRQESHLTRQTVLKVWGTSKSYTSSVILLLFAINRAARRIFNVVYYHST